MPKAKQQKLLRQRKIRAFLMAFTETAGADASLNDWVTYQLGEESIDKITVEYFDFIENTEHKRYRFIPQCGVKIRKTSIKMAIILKK